MHTADTNLNKRVERRPLFLDMEKIRSVVRRDAAVSYLGMGLQRYNKRIVSCCENEKSHATHFQRQKEPKKREKNCEVVMLAETGLPMRKIQVAHHRG